MKHRTTALALAVAAIGTSAATLTPATAAPARPASNSYSSAYAFKSSHKIGKDWKVAVVKVIRNANSACKKADPAFYHKPKKGYQWVVVDFKMKRLKAGPKVSMETDISYVLATNGLKHQYPSELGIVAPNDASGKPSVGKGQSVTGAFTFDVKKTDLKKVRAVGQDDHTLDVEYFKL